MTRTLPKLARLELQILEILWSRGQASVREVQEGFPEPRPASTTVQTTMYRLEGKGAVRRTRKIGNAHIFEPLVARDQARHRQACDERVVAETAAPIAYAEGIVRVCRRYVETPPMSVAGVGGADVKARVDAILANCMGLRLSLAKRLVLAAAAVLSVTVPIVTGAIEAAAFAAGQLRDPLVGPAIDPESRFEVVSIRPADPSAQLRLGMTPGRLDLVGAPVRMVRAMVFPVQRVSGWPDGIDAERYTISAKMPDGASLAARQVAIRNLLKDRFELVTHTETREVPVWGLTGIYDFTLEWTPEAGLSTPSALGLPPDPQPPADPDAPGIFTALQEQLGLKLESGRAPLSIRRD